MKNKLDKAINEKDVENIYRDEILSNTKSATISSPYNTDGLMEAKNVRTLLEFKYDTDLKSKLSQTNILIQCLYYIKKFEERGEKLPSTIFVGDKNECFAIHSNEIVKYLNRDIDWSIAPSTAHNHNADLLKAMVGDNNILPFVYDVDGNFDIKEVLSKIKDLSDNVIRKIIVTKNNISTVFDYFNENVIGETALTTNQKANLFIQIIINPTDNFLNPNRKNLLVSKSYGELQVNSRQYESFFRHFDGDDYSPKQKEELTGVVDRLVEDVVRRNKGEFFTPTNFVDLAHEYITDVYGEDWKERFVVWDNSSGSGNLTRDYNFRELYQSTLEQSDLDTIEQMGYNRGATRFQFDFLNDSDGKLPQGLQDALDSGKEILFLINPPYATASNKDKKEGSHKGGVSTTAVGQEMRDSKQWGASSQQLYSQFLYRIWKYQQANKNIHIALFCPPLYLTGGSFKKFRNKFFNDFGFEKGFLFQASHFSDVSTDWGINLAVFSNKPNDNKDYTHELVQVDADTFNLEKQGKKVIYNLDKGKKASDWVREEVKGVKTFDFPQMASALNVKSVGKTLRGRAIKNHLGYFLSASNNIYENVGQVSMFSSVCSKGNGLSIIKENILKTTALFTARKTIKSDWLNQKDEYFAPNELHPRYRQFELDSLVYSLFNNSSQQSSLRQVDYKGKKWDIKNEFFWLSKNTVLELANEHGNNTVYQDAKNSEERYVASLIEKHYDEFSAEAREILDMGTELLKESFEYREMLNEDNPEFQLNSWDIGYAQVKLITQKFLPVKHKEFRDKYNTWSDGLVPTIYELGFLK